MGMTQLERYRATVVHERPDALLFYLGFTPDLHRRVLEEVGLPEDGDLAAHFGAYSATGIGMKWPDNFSAPDYSKYFEDVDQPEGSHIDGNGCLHVPGSEYHFTRYISPLRNARTMAEIEEFPWHDYSQNTFDHFPEAVRKAHSEGRVASVSCTHMYEEAWQVRGYEEFLMDLLTEAERAHFILNRFMDRNMRMAVAAAEAGADQLHTGDDVANQNTLMFSIDHWRTFMKSKWAEVYAAAHEINPDLQIWYHSDGNISEIIPELIETGVTILNPLQPECIDVKEVKKKYGDRIVIDGAIGTQTTMPFGTTDEVRACVKERVETLGQDGAYIISPTHVLEPEVPVENILAFVEACREYGRL